MGKALRAVVAVIIAAVVAGLVSFIGGFLGLPRGLYVAVAGVIGVGVGLLWLEGEKKGEGK